MLFHVGFKPRTLGAIESGMATPYTTRAQACSHLIVTKMVSSNQVDKVRLKIKRLMSTSATTKIKTTES